MAISSNSSDSTLDYNGNKLVGDPSRHMGANIRRFRATFISKRVIIPRQARDKHRESSKRRCVFRRHHKRDLRQPDDAASCCCVGGRSACGGGSAAAGDGRSAAAAEAGDAQRALVRNAPFSEELFILKPEHFNQDRLGTNIGKAIKLNDRGVFSQGNPAAMGWSAAVRRHQRYSLDAATHQGCSIR
jgi:hypothetical protein|eukprot:COSAG06_NODE_6886_length_2729_cov_1.827376_3_plen_187_part_00